MATRLWCDPASPILPTYKKDLNDYFDIEITVMKLKQAPEASRQAINLAIEKMTIQKIKNLLPPEAITTDTASVLANAMVFQGRWMYQFEKKATAPAPFFLADGTEKETPMMAENAEEFHVYRDKTFQALSLPYFDSRRPASMVILLPTEKAGLTALEEKLTPELWAKITANLKPRRVDLKIPKFRIDTRLELKPCLQRMGITDAFLPDADFSGTSAVSPRWLEDAMHGASVTVNEEGTEAVAVTVAWESDSEMDLNQPEIVTFHADHPFLFIIRDDKSGAVLFMGRFVSPTQ